MGCLKLTYYHQQEALKENSFFSGNTLEKKGIAEKKRIDAYRYGFNGMERDDELKGIGNSINYKARIYDPRLAKFLSVDPLTSSFPWYTPYQFAGNKPIMAIDLDGLEELVVIQWFEGDKYVGSTVFRIHNVNERESSKTEDGGVQVIQLDASLRSQFDLLVNSKKMEPLLKTIQNEDGTLKGEYRKTANKLQRSYIDDLIKTDKNPGQSGIRIPKDHDTDLFFDVDEDQPLEGPSESTIGLLKRFLEADDDLKVSIEGFSSTLGDESYNLALSQRRADNISQLLIQSGIQQERIVISMGNGESIENGSSESQKDQMNNQRVKVKPAYSKKTQ
jgi:RHS repeat-associated protein